MMRLVCLLMLVTLVGIGGQHPAQAQGSSEKREIANLMTLSEAALATVALAVDRNEGTAGNLSWEAYFSQRSWEIEVSGILNYQSYSFNLVGYTWGLNQGDWQAHYSGYGRAADFEPIQINGRADWKFSENINRYSKMDFKHMVKFGRNSWWGWVVGSEVVAGAIVGGTAGAVAGSGAGLIGAVPSAAIGAVQGANGAVTLSEHVRTITESEEPVDPPDPPQRPNMPAEGDNLERTEDSIIISVERHGRNISGSFGNSLVLAGSYEQGYASGEIRIR